jgi:hypothetical protein
VGYKDGEALLGDDHDVALAAQYPGQDVAAFVAALADCGGPGCAGFIERAEDKRWMIHDLLENAPAYVQSRMRMRRYRGQQRRQTEQSGTVAQRLRNGYSSPAPAPAPMATDKEAPPTASPPGKPAVPVAVSESGTVSPPPKPRRSRSTRGITPEQAAVEKRIIDHWTHAWSNRHNGVAFHGTGGDYGRLRKVCQALRWDEALAVKTLDAYLDENEPFYGMHPTTLLIARLSTFAARAQGATHEQRRQPAHRAKGLVENLSL